MLDTARIERLIRLACLLEATARKPGNVHPGASFAGLCYRDFVLAAESIAPVLARTRELGVGRAVLEAATQVQERVGRNTSLGIVLLLAPLAAVRPDVPLRKGIYSVLAGLGREDAVFVYRAIRLTRPGGMGRVGEQDLSQEPTVTLLEAMRLAAGRDRIAAQYAGGFDLVLNVGVPVLEGFRISDFGLRIADRKAEVVSTTGGASLDAESVRRRPGSDWEQCEQAVIALHLHLMAGYPDTLIARKCGREAAEQSAALARGVLDAGWPRTRRGREKLIQLDEWLRAEGNRRNPGTTADLVAACLFAAMRDGHLESPDEERIRAAGDVS